jgi:hypothetical protein
MENCLLGSLFSENEIEHINNTPIKDRQHPVKRLLSNSGEHAQVLVNTERALKFINNEHPDWINRIKNRLTDMEVYSASSSALGEIRAFGYLLEAGYKVVPIIETSETTPDFHVVHNEEIVVVEVHSRQLTDDEAKQLEDFRNKPWPQKEGSRVLARSHVVTPFGKPTPRENVTENVISKLTSIKQEESQFSDKYPSVL